MSAPHPLESELIYDWNRAGGAVVPARGRVEIDDETLRDGLQSPSVKSPSIDKKLRILHLMNELGIDSADIGLPGAGPHVVQAVTRLAREIVDCKMRITPNCAARTVAADILPIIEISQRVGIPIEVACFIGSSPDSAVCGGLGSGSDAASDRRRRLSGGQRGSAGDVRHRRHDARAPRSHPPDVHRGDSRRGQTRLCVRHGRPRHARRRAQPDSVRHGVRRRLGRRSQSRLARTSGSRTRRHQRSLRRSRREPTACTACALGIGERVGNTPMDQLLVNLQLLGWIDRRPDAPSRILLGRVRSDRRARFPTTIPSSGATRFAPARASTPPRSSRRARRETTGSPTASTPACRRRWSVARR